ncbi:MAG: phosphotransferase [Deltaproteobacteria bacterium]|nr:phosphotransferase [Deltaproteobacteria bacterium]
MFVNEPTEEEALETLKGKYGLECQKLEVLASGRVNRSFLATVSGSGERLVLQFLSPVFLKSPALGINWERVSGVMEGRGIPCPRIIRTLDASLLAEGEGHERLARLTTFVPGNRPRAGDPAGAKECGRALGAAHGALNLPRPLALEPLPRGGEYTNQRLSAASDFTDFHSLYRLHPKLPLIEAHLERGARLASELPRSPAFRKIFFLKDLVIHGDPKGDNFLGGESGYSLIDWDTVSYGDPLIDLAELCRSLAVGRERPLFNRELAAAVLEGYRETGLSLPESHYRQIAAAIRAVAVTLGRRYLRDALLENYFVWDRDKHPSRLEQDASRAWDLFDLAEELYLREMELLDL